MAQAGFSANLSRSDFDRHQALVTDLWRRAYRAGEALPRQPKGRRVDGSGLSSPQDSWRHRHSQDSQNRWKGLAFIPLSIGLTKRCSERLPDMESSKWKLESRKLKRTLAPGRRRSSYSR